MHSGCIDPPRDRGEKPGHRLDGDKDAGSAPTPTKGLRGAISLAANLTAAKCASGSGGRLDFGSLDFGSLVVLPACRGPVAARTGKPADASSTVCAQVPGLSILPAFPLSPAGAASRPAFLLLVAEAPAHCRGDGPGLAQARPCLANLKPAPALAKPQCRLEPRPLPQPGVSRGPNRRQPVARRAVRQVPPALPPAPAKPCPATGRLARQSLACLPSTAPGLARQSLGSLPGNALKLAAQVFGGLPDRSSAPCGMAQSSPERPPPPLSPAGRAAMALLAAWPRSFPCLTKCLPCPKFCPTNQDPAPCRP